VIKMSNDEKKSSVLGHLGELRKRLIRSVIAVVITSIICFVFAPQIFDILIGPTQGIKLLGGEEFKPIYIEMTEMIGTYMRCLSPVALYWQCPT